MRTQGDPSQLPRAGERLEMVALSCRSRPICASLLDGAQRYLVRTPVGQRLPVEGESFVLEVSEAGQAGAEDRLRGSISEIHLDVAALGLEPLALLPLSGREHELESIPPATAGSDEPALHRAIDLWAADDLATAEKLLAALLRRDLRCLAAHSCLGFFAFNAPPERGGAARAQRHYEVGLAIAELSLLSFRGLLPWSLPGNRPFLRCLYGRSICLWRRGRTAEARAGLLRLCKLSPGDQLAARVALDGLERRLG